MLLMLKISLFFYDKRKFDDIDAYVDEFLKELQKRNLSQHGWFTEDWLISEIGGDPSDATYFDNLVKNKEQKKKIKSHTFFHYTNYYMTDYIFLVLNKSCQSSILFESKFSMGCLCLALCAKGQKL